MKDTETTKTTSILDIVKRQNAGQPVSEEEYKAVFERFMELLNAPLV